MTGDPHNITSSWPEVTTVDSVLNQWVIAHGFQGDPTPVTQSMVDDLRLRLLDREDNIATILRLAGAQFGAMPGFVSEVIVLAGLGTPPSEEERERIHESFHRDLEELQRMIGEQGN